MSLPLWSAWEKVTVNALDTFLRKCNHHTAYTVDKRNFQEAIVVKAITDSLKENFDWVWGLLVQVVDVCPEAVWAKKAGGFVFWQQLYHCFSAANLILPKDGKPEPGPWGSEVAEFKAEPATTPSKEELKAYAAKMKAQVDAWIATLDDASLLQTHEGLSARWGAPMNNVTAFSAMSGHPFYHIGSCDAILRDNGEKGVM